MPTSLEHVQALTAPIGDLGGRWMLHPEVLEPCKDAGYPNGYAYYVAGRGGVLGDVNADVVASAFGFFAPPLVRRMWDTGVAVEGARAAARRYGAACADFGRRRLTGFDGAGRLADLAGRVAAGADGAGLALFAGWRCEQWPQDVEGRAFFLLHVLRELRGSAHLVAVVAEGMSPRDAVLASGGTEQAQRFGWTGEFPEIAPDAKVAAEARTDLIVTDRYASVLTSGELAEMEALVLAARAHLDAAG